MHDCAVGGKRSLLSRSAFSVLIALALVVSIVPVAFAASQQAFSSLVGPKDYYLALGDSLAFGYQPDLDFDDGYTDDFFHDLKAHGVHEYDNLSCPGETSTTMIKGGCPRPYLRKYPYVGSQLDTALHFLHQHAGKVSPVTLDIGANDIFDDINTSTCLVDNTKFQNELALLDSNLTKVILPKLQAALLVDGVRTGDIVMMNYYDPLQYVCPNTLPYVQILNQHLTADVSGYGVIADVFTTFGGATVPKSTLCEYIWICSPFHDIHAKDKGYALIAQAFEKRTGY